MLARHSRLVIATLVAAFALASTSFVSAADTAWTGATNGVWATSSNWSGSAVPTAADNVFLTSPAVVNNTITLPVNATANRLTASGNAYTLTTGSLALVDNLYVDDASARLDITSGAIVTSPNATIGISGGNSGNQLNLSSRLDVAGTLNVGYDGTGNQLSVNAGGHTTAAALWLGGVATSASNAATVLASGTATTTSTLVVGYGGDANTIAVAGRVAATQSYLGYDAGADRNIATVSAGGRWTNAGPLTVGVAGTGNEFRVTSGTLSVTGTANDVIVGDAASATGNRLAVSGGSFSSLAALVIGKTGSGNAFSATNGATVTGNNARFGLNAGSDGNAGTVDGVGTTWGLTNKLRVGSDSNDNSLAITGGGAVTVASDVFVGGTSTGSAVSGNSVMVTGSGSSLTIVSSTADLVISYGTGTNNKVTVADGGTLALSSIKMGPNGTLQVGSGAAAGTVSPAATIDSPFGGGAVVFNHSSASHTFANPISGGISVTQQGSGKTVLTGSNSYTGSTTVSSGTLALSAAANNIASSGTISVAAGSVLDVSGVTGGFALASAQTLAGSGSVSGAATAASGATVAPGGAAIGTLSFGSSLSLVGSLEIGLAGSTTDLLAVAGGLTLDPASIVDFSVVRPLNQAAYVFGSYATLAGTFGTVNGLPTGYTVDYNYLSGNQLALVAVPEPSTLGLAVAGMAAAIVAVRRRKEAA